MCIFTCFFFYVLGLRHFDVVFAQGASKVLCFPFVFSRRSQEASSVRLGSGIARRILGILGCFFPEMFFLSAVWLLGNAEALAKVSFL